ncbi:hypothetical protein SKAU_G00186550 [Synaphobranchus kaupii]|uniref:Uncharacterized protein n=1 Tax=Synaphobranchus kaupii TaxID=118154 RepID=A0A9Q1FCQ1_SYNKA|nr:hypothetical protein SKAU_G00186550 [Synaphobranchus kaupii]
MPHARCSIKRRLYCRCESIFGAADSRLPSQPGSSLAPQCLLLIVDAVRPCEMENKEACLSAIGRRGPVLGKPPNGSLCVRGERSRIQKPAQLDGSEIKASRPGTCPRQLPPSPRAARAIRRPVSGGAWRGSSRGNPDTSRPALIKAPLGTACKQRDLAAGDGSGAWNSGVRIQRDDKTSRQGPINYGAK